MTDKLDIDNLPGFKREQLQKCFYCSNGMAHGGQITFYEISTKNYVIDPKVIQERHGLEQMLGGGGFGAMMAGVMGPDSDIAKQISETKPVLVCSDCFCKKRDLAMLLAEEVGETNE